MRQLLFLILFFYSLYGAIDEFHTDDFQILIGENFDDEALDLVEDHDYGLSIVGYSQDYKTTSSENKSFNNAFEYLQSIRGHNGEQLRLIKLDQAANNIKDVRFALADFNRGTHIQKNADNGYFLGGYTQKGDMLFSSLNAQGKIQFIKQFGTANNNRLDALVQLKDESSIVIGTSKTSRNNKDNLFIQGLGKEDIYLGKFRSDGTLVWEKKFGTSDSESGVDAIATDDGGFILIGISQKNMQSELMAARINDTGNTIWTQTFSKPGREKAFKIIKTGDDNYLISASFENKNTQDNIRLLKINGAGNLLWEKNLDADSNEQLNDIAIDLKGNIIGVGYCQGKKQSDKDALVRYFDPKGNLIWERKFGKERQDAFKSVSLLHDNSFAIAGFSNSFADKGKQIWVLKLNDDGSFVKKQVDKYLGLYEALVKEFRKEPKIHILKDLRISHDGLIFKQGSSLLTPEHKVILKDFMPRLVKILSHYKKSIKNFRINGFTSTEWNAPQTQRYLNNAHLSNDRAMHIVDYAYSLDDLKKYQTWISGILSTDGYSYSNLIYADKKENKKRSRRVEFEIILK